MRSNFSEYVQLAETLPALTALLVKYTGRRRCRGRGCGLVCSEQGSLSSPALCFSLLCQLLTPLCLNPLSTTVKMPTPTRRIPPRPHFPLCSASSPQSPIALSNLYRLAFLYSSGATLLFFPFHYLFFVSFLFRRLPAVRPISPPYFSQSVSQSEQQPPQPCQTTRSQTVVPVETYSKRLLFFSPVPVTEMRHGNQPLVENTPCLLLPAQQTHHLEQTAELPWSRWRSSGGRSAGLQYVSTRKLTALWRRNLHSSVSEQHPRNVSTTGGIICVAISSSRLYSPAF